MIVFPAVFITPLVEIIYTTLLMKMTPIGKILWLLLSVTCAVFLFVGGPTTDSLRSIREFWDIGHVVCFALWGYGYTKWRHQSFWRKLIEVLLLAACVGALTELIQSQIGRDANFEDLWHDIVGGFLGFLICQLYPLKRLSWHIALTALAVVLITATLLIPTLKATTDDLIAWQHFPLLSGFESPFEKLRWGGSAARKVVSQHATTGNYALRVQFSTQRYSGLSLRSVHHNWEGYQELQLQLFNPGQDEFVIHMRIDDKQHNNEYTDRFNTSFTIRPGANTLTISLSDVEHAPKNRSIDLKQIANVGLFVGKLSTPRIVYIDDVLLISTVK